MSSPYLRVVGALGLGSLFALGLFWLMTVLVQQEAELGERRPPSQMSFIRMPEPEPELRHRRRQPPEPPELPPPPPQQPLAQAEPQAAPPPLPLPAMSPPSWQSSLAPGGIPVMAEPAGPVDYTRSLTPISQVPPQYPRRAMMEGISGWVRLAFVIEADGSVGEIEVLEASPRRNVFDQEAVRALSRWRFRPQQVDGQPVAARAEITINFELDG